MKYLIAVLLLLPTLSAAHPGIGIVMDSRGAIFYTDLERVWKISDGRKSIAVPDVHTHELYIDNADNLYGEHQWNDAAGKHFYHYYWKLTPDGRLDTVVGARAAFVHADFPLARDQQGAAYYLKPNDTSHIFRRSRTGQEITLATGPFKDLKWLHPQSDGSVLYVLRNTVYRIGKDGTTRVVSRNIASDKPSFAFTTGTDNIMIFGAWQDAAGNVYVACFSDAAVKKIDSAGRVSVFYKSAGDWSPTHGLFDKNGRLWVLECSDKNEIRVVQAGAQKPEDMQKNGATQKRSEMPLLGWAALGVAGWLLVYPGFRARRRKERK